MLELRRVSKNFGGLRALNSIDLHLDQGEILGLIGPNGAGKSTAFNCIAGVFPPSEGEILFQGRRINGEKPWDLCRAGLARTFQIVKPFSSKTVLYNVAVGAFARTGSRAAAEAKALDVLRTLKMDDRKDVRAGQLTIVDRKRLEIARALATEPKLILLDEVMAGLRPTEVDDMVGIIRSLRTAGLTVLLIEHIMRAVMALSDRVVVIHFGTKIAEGTPAAVAADEKVIKAYLGDEYVAARNS
jgi:branched-chain amino acid transport system ATP-binding protein